MKHKLALNLVAAIAMGVSGIGYAGAQSGMGHMAGMQTAAQSAASGVGVVKQVKPERGQVKISHEAIAALGWGPMTMNFRVKDKSVLEDVAVGDKVNFELEKGSTGLVITHIQKAK